MPAIAHKGQIIMSGDTGVSSFNNRTGAVSPTAGDYDATQVNYDSNTTVKQKIDSLVTGVSSFNNRTGAITPVAGDYDATQVTYSSGVTTKQKIDSVEGVKTTPVSCLVGDTDVTITNSAIHTTSTIDIYYETVSGNPITYTSAVVTEGQIVITFASALEEAASVKLRITN